MLSSINVTHVDVSRDASVPFNDDSVTIVRCKAAIQSIFGFHLEGRKSFRFTLPQSMYSRTHTHTQGRTYLSFLNAVF